jgi:hypothetical protein
MKVHCSSLNLPMAYIFVEHFSNYLVCPALITMLFQESCLHSADFITVQGKLTTLTESSTSVYCFGYRFKHDSPTEPRTTEPRMTEPRKTQPRMD